MKPEILPDHVQSPGEVQAQTQINEQRNRQKYIM